MLSSISQNLINWIVIFQSSILLKFSIYTIKKFNNIPFFKSAARVALIQKYAQNEKFFQFQNVGKVIKDFSLAEELPTKINVHNSEKVKTEIIIKNKCEDKRLTIFAHYDKHLKVDPYVVYFLKHLNEIGYEVIFCTEGMTVISDDLKKMLFAAIRRLTPGYDFTSWYTAFMSFPDLFKAKEILLCNDSIFAPMGSFKPIHDLMDKVNCDFWGLSESREKTTHLQSYYLVFKQNAINSKAFRRFWSNLNVANRADAIYAELNFTMQMVKGGLVPAAYINADCVPVSDISPVHFFWRQLVDLYHFPCLKRDLLSGKVWGVNIKDWREVACRTGYDPQLIDQYFKRLRQPS